MSPIRVALAVALAVVLGSACGDEITIIERPVGGGGAGEGGGGVAGAASTTTNGSVGGASGSGTASTASGPRCMTGCLSDEDCAVDTPCAEGLCDMELPGQSHCECSVFNFDAGEPCGEGMVCDGMGDCVDEP